MAARSEVDTVQQVVVTGKTERSTLTLIWAVVAVVLMLLALVAYGFMTGVFGSGTPQNAQDDELASTAAAIAKNPTDGSQYAVRAEALYRLGRKAEAYRVLDQGEKAVKGKNPALLYILRSRTSLLNQDRRFADAEKTGRLAMKASDSYLAMQGAVLASKGVTGITGNMKTTTSVDTAVQLADAYMGLKKYDKAVEMYSYALRIDPMAGDVLTMRGWAYLSAGKKAKAKADFALALQYLPDDPSAARGLKQASN